MLGQHVWGSLQTRMVELEYAREYELLCEFAGEGEHLDMGTACAKALWVDRGCHHEELQGLCDSRAKGSRNLV